ncbi:MAG TPA: SRPBCC domain-containing protein [Mycobacteriales bacterium]|nr:SRPBCC domain-containing protein [Mycobacteriales bacterium]HWA65552.1 SRPBCC domain-containing protein [Mycobacteriales bacterium]
MTSPDVLTATVRISAPPEAVFPYLVDPALMVEWIGEWADLDPQPGGSFALDFASTAVRGSYVEVDPPHRVVFTWGVPGHDTMPPGSSTVEISLTADGPQTVVELVHRDLPPDEYDSHLDGWTTMLPKLAAASGR